MFDTLLLVLILTAVGIQQAYFPEEIDPQERLANLLTAIRSR